MGNSIDINQQSIGAGHPPYFIAELSANHNQQLGRARRLIEAAAEAGADAVKLQTYRPDTLTIDSPKEFFRISDGTAWDGQTLYELYESAYTPWEWHGELRDLTLEKELDFFSTAYDPTAVDFLEELGVPCHKVASFEIVDLPLIERMAATGKPLIVSTGMASLGEIEDAVNVIRETGNESFVLLKCTSSYPAKPKEMNLNTIPNLSETFRCPVGLSDHSLGIEVPLAAIALGACVIEKHLTLSRESESPDSHFSLEPDEFQKMAEKGREVARSLGGVQYGPTETESRNVQFRRSLFVVKDVEPGQTFTRENVRSIRPGYGLAPKHMQKVLGKRAARDVERGTPLSWELVKSKKES